MDAPYYNGSDNRDEIEPGTCLHCGAPPTDDCCDACDCENCEDARRAEWARLLELEMVE